MRKTVKKKGVAGHRLFYMREKKRKLLGDSLNPSNNDTTGFYSPFTNNPAAGPTYCWEEMFKAAR